MQITFFKNIRLPKKFYWREVLAVFLLVVCIYFFHQQRREISLILPYLHQASNSWLLLAAVVTGIFVLCQSAMYAFSFNAIKTPFPLSSAIELFLKRNFLSTFLPGGGVSALAYVPKSVKRTVPDRMKIHQASGLFGFAGILSTFIISLTVLLLAAGGGNSKDMQQTAIGMGVLTILIALLLFVLYNIRKEKALYQWIKNRYPKTALTLLQVTGASVDGKWYLLTVFASIGVEVCGIAHLYIAMLAAGVHPSLQAAGLAYVISVLLMVASPFLRGVGAVELSVVYILGHFGYTPVEALAIALIYRAFEFWLPMLCGLFSFLVKGKALFLRIFPAFTIFLLGVVNILSVLTPPVAQRMKMLHNFVNAAEIHASNTLVIYIGVALIVTATFLIRGLRNAWWLAFIFTLVSLGGHITKGLDWEEAILALIVLLSLLFSRKQYTVRTNPRLISRALTLAISTFVAVMVYGYIGFYFLKTRHFGIDFNRYQSLGYTLRIFLLQKIDLEPLTPFASEFLISMYALALGAWIFLLYALVKPYLSKSYINKETDKALQLLQKYGCSSVDFFKIANDKLLYFSKQYEAFVAYRIENGFALVLEVPVCAEENLSAVLEEFSDYCNHLGLKTAYYRVDENSLSYFEQQRKKSLLIGQEAIVDVEQFDLAGRDKKSLRNGLNSLQKKGYITAVYCPPYSTELMQQLKAVSDEWLQVTNRTEMIFSQGSFDEDINLQELIITKNADGMPVAFLNIIPDFAPGECTYDLIRKTSEAPGGCMDALIIELIKYAKEKGCRFVNLGLAPMSGLEHADKTLERLMRYAYEKIRRFRHYQGLRAFKEKYASQWLNKYLVYDNDFDLLRLPAVLNKAMKPIKHDE
ncbi:lysylphosphatidylglycerol synthetase family protein [Ilyomonas limi]|uniref:Phosphatidylglycerol lysyltransferase n=1 Tax=Ilyomonas limi TaxID=2575867 RepID=A0A4U3L1I8_9BACT|nr:phosphatidylglycerol lysyltransferase domain-containing protein [Ilyomonas limi]TKK69001.1 lysylphosphatidylglycerol synthetase family protein [Ilyomonas limi]